MFTDNQIDKIEDTARAELKRRGVLHHSYNTMADWVRGGYVAQDTFDLYCDLWQWCKESNHLALENLYNRFSRQYGAYFYRSFYPPREKTWHWC